MTGSRERSTLDLAGDDAPRTAPLQLDRLDLHQSKDDAPPAGEAMPEQKPRKRKSNNEE